MDELERKLAEPMRAAADAEEFSEQLDVRKDSSVFFVFIKVFFQLLERLMEGKGNHGRIMDIGNELIHENLIVNTVQSELSKYNARRDGLLEPVIIFRSGLTEMFFFT